MVDEVRQRHLQIFQEIVRQRPAQDSDDAWVQKAIDAAKKISRREHTRKVLAGVLLQKESAPISDEAAKDAEVLRRIRGGASNRGDQKDKVAFQAWLKDKNISVSWMSEIKDMKRGVPDNIATILGAYSDKTLKDWYKEVYPGTLKSGRRPNK